MLKIIQAIIFTFVAILITIGGLIGIGDAETSHLVIVAILLASYFAVDAWSQVKS